MNESKMYNRKHVKENMMFGKYDDSAVFFESKSGW